MTNNLQTPFTAEIRRRALAANISIRSLLKRAGVANNILHTWEVKRQHPQDATLEKIYKVLDEVENENGN